VAEQTDLQSDEHIRLAPWIGFQSVPGIGPARLARLISLFGSIANAWDASIADLREAGVSAEMARAIHSTRETFDIQAEIRRMERAGVHAITADSSNYPRLLQHVPGAPTVLYARGSLVPEDEAAVAIVGTRRATRYGLDMAARLAADLASAGITIVSGLAYGVDTAAHRAAVEAGGRTIAVLGSGPDTIYPAQNRRLAERVIEQGALVSEYPVGTKPDARNFPARNRIISGMSRGVIVVEAPTASGAMLTASFAADQSRDVFAVPGQATSNASAGCHALIRDGATLITDASHVLEQLHLANHQAHVQVRMTLPESAGERILYALIGTDPVHLDEICLASGRPIYEVTGTLLEMELKGLVRQTAPQYYVRA